MRVLRLSFGNHFMKKTIVAAALLASVFTASAQGYAGAVIALTKFGNGCDATLSCDKAKGSMKIYAGSKFKSANTIDLGVGSINAFEVSYIKFGSRRSSGNFDVPDVTDGSIVTTAYPGEKLEQIDALTAALVANFPIVEQLDASVKLGLAYVSTSTKTQVNINEVVRSQGGETTNKLKPYLGLGLAYAVPDVFKVVLSYDLTRRDTSQGKGNIAPAGKSGSISAFGLGLEKAY